MTDEYDRVARKLRKMAEENSGPIEGFTHKEVEVIRRIIAWVDFFERMGVLGKWALWLLTATAGAILAWEQIVARIVQR